jgi:hypothetical protein
VPAHAQWCRLLTPLLAWPLLLLASLPFLFRAIPSFMPSLLLSSHTHLAACHLQSELDELEREEFFRLKKVQKNKQKAAPPTKGPAEAPQVTIRRCQCASALVCTCCCASKVQPSMQH